MTSCAPCTQVDPKKGSWAQSLGLWFCSCRCPPFSTHNPRPPTQPQEGEITSIYCPPSVCSRPSRGQCLQPVPQMRKQTSHLRSQSWGARRGPPTPAPCSLCWVCGHLLDCQKCPPAVTACVPGAYRADAKAAAQTANTRSRCPTSDRRTNEAEPSGVP